MNTKFLLLFLLIPFLSIAQPNLNVIGEGATLTYAVNESGVKYNLIATIKQFKSYGNDDIVFDWKMEGGKSGSGKVSIPHGNRSYWSKLILNLKNGNNKLQKEEMVFLFPENEFGVGESSSSGSSSIDVNDITFTIHKEEHMFPAINLKYNNEVKEFPYWELSSTGSFPEVDYKFRLAGIKAKLDNDSDADQGDPYKVITLIQYVSIKGFEMKLTNVKAPYSPVKKKRWE